MEYKTIRGNLMTMINQVKSFDKGEDLIWWVATNPNTPIETLKVLATDEDGIVRKRVADNSSTPEEILKVLATDEYQYVRRGVAENPNTPEDIEMKIRMCDNL